MAHLLPVEIHDLHAAGLAVTSDLDLNELLKRVAEEARKLTRAAFGALGILNGEKTELAQFITAGMAEEEAAETEGQAPEGPPAGPGGGAGQDPFGGAGAQPAPVGPAAAGGAKTDPFANPSADPFQ